MLLIDTYQEVSVYEVEDEFNKENRKKEKQLEEELERDMKPRLIGEPFRKYPTEKSNQKATYGLFECQYCKKEFEAQTKHIKRGHTKSCGCLRGDAHGLNSKW